MRRPWFPFYATDWLNDRRVRMVSRAARSCYLDLLCEIWNEGPIPDDQAFCARLLGESNRTFGKFWAEIRPLFFEFSPGKLSQRRLEAERAECEEKASKARKSAEERWSPYANALPTHSERNAKAMLARAHSQSQSQPQSQSEEIQTPSKPGVGVLPGLEAPKSEISPADLQSAYALYPRKIGKTDGLKRLAKEIRTREQFETLTRAIGNFTKQMRRESRPDDKILYFSSFAGEWRDWIDFEAPAVNSSNGTHGHAKAAPHNAESRIRDDF